MAPCTATTTSLMTLVFTISGRRVGDSFLIQSIPGQGWMTRPRTYLAADQSKQRCRLAAETRLLAQSSANSSGDRDGDDSHAKADHVRGGIQPDDRGMWMRSSTPTIWLLYCVLYYHTSKNMIGLLQFALLYCTTEYCTVVVVHCLILSLCRCELLRVRTVVCGRYCVCVMIRSTTYHFRPIHYEYNRGNVQSCVCSGNLSGDTRYTIETIQGYEYVSARLALV